MIDTKTFGQAVRNKRELNRLSVAELANLINVTPRYIYQIEAGKRIPKMEIAVSLMTALDIDIKVFTASNDVRIKV